MTRQEWINKIKIWINSKVKNSPLSNDNIINNIIENGIKYGVNPTFLIGISFAESTLGTRGVAITTKSLGNITAKNYNDILLNGNKNTCGSDYCRTDIKIYTNPVNNRSYRHYNNWQDSIQDTAERWARSGYKDIKDFSLMLNRWTGSVNDSYVNAVKSVMVELDQISNQLYNKVYDVSDFKESTNPPIPPIPPTKKVKVFLSAGHDIKDPGAINSARNIRESDCNMGIRDICKQVLENHGVEVITTPDELLGLVNTINWINARSKSDDWKRPQEVIAIDIHCNSNSTTSGTEVWYYTGFTPSQQLAKVIVDINAKNLKIPNRGTKPDVNSRFGRFGFVRDTNPLAVLVEMGFMGGDIDIVTNYDLCGKSLAEGILDHFGIEYKDKPEEKNPIAEWKGQEVLINLDDTFGIEIDYDLYDDNDNLVYAWFVRQDPNVSNNELINNEPNTSVLMDSLWIDKNQVNGWQKKPNEIILRANSKYLSVGETHRVDFGLKAKNLTSNEFFFVQGINVWVQVKII